MLILLSSPKGGAGWTQNMFVKKIFIGYYYLYLHFEPGEREAPLIRFLVDETISVQFAIMARFRLFAFAVSSHNHIIHAKNAIKCYNQNSTARLAALCRSGRAFID